MGLDLGAEASAGTPAATAVGGEEELLGDVANDEVAGTPLPCDTAELPVIAENSSTPEALPLGALELNAAAFSDVGGRACNEDSYAIDGQVVCVSDGIGGAPFGDAMSRVCCGRLVRELAATDFDSLGLERGIADACQRTDDFATEVSESLGTDSGATLVTMAAAGSRLAFARVGDSNAFVLNAEGRLESVFLDDGRRAGEGNALEAAMGYGILRHDLGKLHVATHVPGGSERYLLCSDGVWTQLGEDELARLLAQDASPEEIARELVGRAVEAYGPYSDNATAAVVFVEPVPA